MLSLFNSNKFVIAQNKLSVDEINLIAKKTTVLIAPQLTQEDLQDLIENKPRDDSSSWSVSSGVIVGKQDNQYFVLTVAHSFQNKRLNDNQSYAIVTNDRKVHILNRINDHRGEPQCPQNYDELMNRPISNDTSLFRFGCYESKKLNGYDIAIVSFESTESYPLASIGDGNILKQGDIIYISGWPKLENEPKLSNDGTPLLDSEGKIVCMGMAPRRQRRLAWSPLQGKLKFLENLNGYNLLYLDYTRPGMSGGPIFNTMGYLVGIHGQGSKNKLRCGQVYQAQTKKINSAINESDDLEEVDTENTENWEDESVSNVDLTIEDNSLDVEDIKEEELKLSEENEETIDNNTTESLNNNEFSKGQNLNNVLTLLKSNKKYFSVPKSSDSILSQISDIKTNPVLDINSQGNEPSSGRIEFGAFDDQTDEIEDVYQLFSFKLENMLRLQPSGGCGSLLLGDKCSD